MSYYDSSLSYYDSSTYLIPIYIKPAHINNYYYKLDLLSSFTYQLLLRCNYYYSTRCDSLSSEHCMRRHVVNG